VRKGGEGGCGTAAVVRRVHEWRCQEAGTVGWLVLPSGGALHEQQDGSIAARQWRKGEPVGGRPQSKDVGPTERELKREEEEGGWGWTLEGWRIGMDMWGY
jgi:hypothetical protein